MAFVLPLPTCLNSSIHSTPRCAIHTPPQKTSRSLSVAAVGIASAALVAGLNVADAIEFPHLPLPQLPSISIPGLPDVPKLGEQERTKNIPSDLSEEQQGKVDDMMGKLDAKKKARTTNM